MSSLRTERHCIPSPTEVCSRRLAIHQHTLLSPDYLQPVKQNTRTSQIKLVSRNTSTFKNIWMESINVEGCKYHRLL